MPARILPPVGMRAGPCPSRVGAVPKPPCTVTTGCGLGWAMMALLHECRDVPTIHALAASQRFNPAPDGRRLRTPCLIDRMEPGARLACTRAKEGIPTDPPVQRHFDTGCVGIKRVRLVRPA